MKYLSDDAFRLFLSVTTGGAAGLWTIHDAVFLWRLRADRPDRSEAPLVADKRFGYGIGIVVGLVGVIGTLRFNGVL